MPVRNIKKCCLYIEEVFPWTEQERIIGIYDIDNENNIIPRISVNVPLPTSGPWIIKNIYGPTWGETMYFLLMHLAGEVGLRPTVKDSEITVDAIKSWKRVADNNTRIVSIPCTLSCHEDPWLNKVYRVRDDFMDIDIAIKNNEKYISAKSKGWFNKSRNIDIESRKKYVDETLRKFAIKSTESYVK